jgi:hypothetical protein
VIPPDKVATIDIVAIKTIVLSAAVLVLVLVLAIEMDCDDRPYY